MFDSDQIIEIPVDGKFARTSFERIKIIKSDKYGPLSLVKLDPLTGRRHQLRKHLAALGSPILGDKLYGSSDSSQTKKGLFLHAIVLDFNHPESGERKMVRSDIPKKFEEFFFISSNA